MLEVQYLQAGGQQYAVLPRTVLDDLLSRVPGGKAAGETPLADPGFSPLVLEKARAAKNRIRMWREHRGMKAVTLAKATGISPAYLSELESGRKDGSMKVMRQLAEALGVGLEELG